MSNEETLYDSWSDYPHAMTARASWTDKTDPEELKNTPVWNFRRLNR